MRQGDFLALGSYHPNMPRKTTPPKAIGPDWFIQEWMRSKHVKQADLARLLDWPKAKMNDIYHGRTEYYRGIVNPIATALRVEPWELFMHPEDANALKAMQASALRLVAEKRDAFKPADTPAENPGDRLAPPTRRQRRV